MRKRSFFASVLAVMLCVLLFASCTTTKDPAVESDTIKVGFIGPKTGGVAQYGLAVLSGIEMYIDEINANGGVLGKQIELISYDDKGDAMEAMNAFTRLVEQDNVVAVFGSVTSGPTLAIAEESANMENPIPMITASATHPDVTSFGTNMFRSCFLDPFQGSTMARYAKEVLGATTAAVLYDNADDYSTGLMESFAATCAELGIEIVASEGYVAGDVDFKSQLTNIQAKSPDVFFVPGYYTEVVLVAEQAATMGIDATLLGCDGWDGVLEKATDAASLEGCFFSSHYTAADPDALVQGFLQSYEAKYGTTPSSFCATGYDAAMIMFDAIERAGTTESSAVVAALAATDLDCVTGHITFDAQNNPIKTCAIVTVQDGEYALDRNI